MGSGRSVAVLKQFRALFEVGTAGGLTDGQLLERFVRRDAEAEAAFEVLVARHGPIILQVCRGILGNRHDAEDASQATFLVLARKAGSIRKSDSVASWLFGVACRVSARAKADAARRAARERRGAEMATRVVEEGDGPGAWPELYEEVERLPEHYRAAIVLCHLEGLTYEQAARRLRCPVRTIQSRLARGRERLRGRLARRGVTLSAGLLEAASARGSDSTAVPAAWAEATARAAMGFTAKHAATAGTVSASVAALAEGALNAMFLNKLKLTAAALLAVVATAAGAAALAQQSEEAGPPPTPNLADTVFDRARAPIAVATRAEPAEEPRVLTRDDGRPAGKRSIAGGGHAVRFEAPGEGWSLTGVRIHGARYGYPKPPAEDYKVYLCDEKFQPIADFAFPYSTFVRGEQKWVTLDVKPTKLPATFILCVGFNPTQTKGVYVSHDGEGSGMSMVGLPGSDSEPFDKGDWMIRARVERKPDAGAPKAKGD